MILDKLPPNTRSLINQSRERHTLSTSGRSAKSTRRTRPTHASRFLQETSENIFRTETNKDKEEKVILNTWVDGGTEIANLIGRENPREEYPNEKQMINQRDKIRDYEEILQDSPTNTQTQSIFDDINQKKSYVDSMDLDSENIDQIIQDISELSKKTSQIKKGHKRGISHATGPPGDVKIKRLIHQSSMLINSTDLESMFKKTKVTEPTEKFDKMDLNRVNRFYSDQRKCRSSLSLSLKDMEAGRVNKFITFLSRFLFSNFSHFFPPFIFM